MIQDKKLPDSILQCHQTVMLQLQDRCQQLQTSLQQLAKANDNTEQRRAALKDLSLKLEQWGGEKAQKTDSKHLPWGRLVVALGGDIFVGRILGISDIVNFHADTVSE